VSGDERVFDTRVDSPPDAVKPFREKKPPRETGRLDALERT
jgi:hypothetical protein